MGGYVAPPTRLHLDKQDLVPLHQRPKSEQEIVPIQGIFEELNPAHDDSRRQS